MVAYKTLGSLLLSLFLLTNISLAGDSINVNTFNFSKWNKINNPWMNTSNIAGLVYNTSSSGEFNTGYNHQSGDFKPLMNGDNFNEFFLQTVGYQKINKLFLFGEFTYSLNNEENTLWNGTYDPYRGNPYIIGDSVRGATYHKEEYRLNAGVSTSLNKNTTLGVKFNYLVGVGAKQKDPRPENTVTMFAINPGIIIQKGKMKIGFDLGVSNRKEEIDYIQVVTDKSDPSYFTFKGFGFYTYEIKASYDRFQSQKEIFGGFQLETDFANLHSISEIRANYGIEAIDDGSSVIKKSDAGDWKQLKIVFNEQLKRAKNNSIQLVKLNAGFVDGKGIEYNQERVYEGNTTQYKTISKNMKFNRTTIWTQANYNFLSLKENGLVHWDLKANAGFKFNQEKYHYIPEVFSADYMNVDGGISITKNIYAKRLHFAPELSASYQYNLSNSINLSNDEEVTKKQFQNVYIGDFNYFKTDVLNVMACLNIGLNTTQLENINQVYLKLSYNYSNAINTDQTLGILSAKIGFVF